jgi:two-component system sensor histidine kinase KdpD
VRTIAVRTVAAAATVALVTGVCRAGDVDLTVASLALLVTVVVAGLLGALPVMVAACLGFLALNWFFTPPTGSLRIAHVDDVVALAVFVLAAAVVGFLVHRLDALHRSARRRELEARLRLDLAGRVTSGDLDTVLVQAAEALAELFALGGCRIRTDSRTVETGRVDPAVAVRTAAPGLVVEATPHDGPMHDTDRELLEAMTVGLAASVDRARLVTEIDETRVTAAMSQQRAGFISAVSHNLRTPLTAIKAAASALLASWSRLEPTERRELVESIYEESERLERLVQNTLELSRIRAGGLEARPEEVDVGDIVRIAVRRLRPIARSHLVRLVVSDDLGPVVLDVVMAQEIMLNLLENALRYAPPGSEIVVSALPAGTKRWELRVADHGPGVPPALRHRIFDEFTSAETNTQRRGTGLGLAIVRALVVAQGGSVDYEESEGGGATFVCTFPRAHG